jgi:hypothetical protein
MLCRGTANVLPASSQNPISSAFDLSIDAEDFLTLLDFSTIFPCKPSLFVFSASASCLFA